MTSPTVTVDSNAEVEVTYPSGIVWTFRATERHYTPEERQSHDSPGSEAGVVWDYDAPRLHGWEGEGITVPTLPTHVFEDADEAVRAHFIDKRRNNCGGAW